MAPIANAFAQNPGGVRPMDSAQIAALKASNRWLTSSTTFYQNIYPVLRTIPPLEAVMPDTVQTAYIYVDSLLRFDTAMVAFDRIQTWSSVKDTLKGMLRWLYQMVDYDPARWHQYRLETAILDRYMYALDNLAYPLYGRFHAIMRPPLRDAFLAAAQSDFVLRVTVSQVDSTLNPRDNQLVYRVYATVTDTLKGRVFPKCETPSLPSKVTADSTATICFSYWRNVYSNFVESNGGPVFQWEPRFTRPDSMGFRMVAGQDAVVFLRFAETWLDTTRDAFHLVVTQSSSNGALPIVSDTVYDVNNVWSLGSSAGYSTWRSKFLDVADRLKVGRY
ncbi:MAG TPA: hypothetical protein VNA88_06530, partial [Candidatus Kapabacteria bacterium]|jgi:hypothetical protein|nr:hypothetical protein [Candidatus Kapabacteria bacterium]